MGNLCSKELNRLSNSDTISTTNSMSSLEMIYDFKLHYVPRSGEGESVKVLLTYLNVPFREKIEYDSDALTVLKCKEAEIHGTIPCLRYLSKRFGLYPSDVYTAEEICSQIAALWHLAREDFYSNNRAKIHDFYTKQLPLFLSNLETHLNSNSQGIVGNQVSFCDLMTVTFVYNLFYRDAYTYVLRQNAPMLMEFCQRFVKNHLQDYFSSRSFSLYI